jgi:cation diffusion facilitator family transporter
VSNRLTRFAWLSITAAVATIGLKTAGWWLTGSVGLLSDALESVVNLVAAVMTLAMLTIAARPADERHAYGYSKAEYFASGVEGGLILLAAAAIAWTAIPRLQSPAPIEQAWLGLGISLAASVVNLVVARKLLGASKRFHSIALEADAHHLMTDVWTSAGVLGAIALVAVTGWARLDPIIALVVAANIIWTGVGILRRSAQGLLDQSLPEEELASLRGVLAGYEPGLQFHALRTRQAGSRRFVSLHILVPGDWTVTRGHQMLEEIEGKLRAVIPNATVFTHLEPIGDPSALEDMELDRSDSSAAPG